MYKLPRMVIYKLIVIVLLLVILQNKNCVPFSMVMALWLFFNSRKVLL